MKFSGLMTGQWQMKDFQTHISLVALSVAVSYLLIYFTITLLLIGTLSLISIPIASLTHQYSTKWISIRRKTFRGNAFIRVEQGVVCVL